MAKIFDIHSIIVPAQTPNFTAHTYSEIYGGILGCTVTINGTSVSVGAASGFNILVRSISGGNGCYLLGDNQNANPSETLLG
jgi:hypothetical protein